MAPICFSYNTCKGSNQSSLHSPSLASLKCRISFSFNSSNLFSITSGVSGVVGSGVSGVVDSGSSTGLILPSPCMIKQKAWVKRDELSLIN